MYVPVCTYGDCKSSHTSQASPISVWSCLNAFIFDSNKYAQAVLQIAAASSGRQYAHTYRDSHDHHWPASNYLVGRRCSGVAAYSRLLWVPHTEDSVIWRRDPSSRQLCSMLACPGCQRMLDQMGMAAGCDYRRLGDISGKWDRISRGRSREFSLSNEGFTLSIGFVRQSCAQLIALSFSHSQR